MVSSMYFHLYHTGSGLRVNLDSPEREWQPTGGMIYPRAHFHLIPWSEGLVAAIGKYFVSKERKKTNILLILYSFS